MNNESTIFPIHLACNDKGWSEHAFRKSFLEAKPKELIWFGYDTIIHSQTDVEFVVYDMLDNMYGGLGKRIGAFKTAVSEQVTGDAINRRIMALATARRHRELSEAEAVIIKSYADEIRASSLSRPNQNSEAK